MTQMPNRLFFAHTVTQTGFMALIAGGGWLLHQSAIAHVDGSMDIMADRFEARFDTLETKIDANGGLIRRNGEQITELRERMAAVEIRVGSLEDAIRFFHPPEGAAQEEP